MLVLLYPRHDGLVIPLIQRTENVELHKGQVSLPGGAREPQDGGFSDTALRETREELGIPEHAIEVLRALTPLFIPVSRFCVYPYVGCSPHAFPMHSDPNEVAEVIEAPLEHLLDPTTRTVEAHVRDGQQFQVPVYQVGHAKVWGATAMILAEFLALVRAQTGL